MVQSFDEWLHKNGFSDIVNSELSIEHLFLYEMYLDDLRYRFMKEIEENYVWEVMKDEIHNSYFQPFQIKTIQNKSFCVGTYIFSENLVNVFLIHSKGKQDMKKMLDYLTIKFNTSRVRFYGVADKEKFSNLRGFEEEYIYDKVMGEKVFCLRGIWRNK